MSYSMTEAEINRAATLLEEEEISEIEKIAIGRWALASDRGLYGVYDTKAIAIDIATGDHDQYREHCKVRRHRKGVYSLDILDCDEDPSEKFYHHFRLERITADNILELKEIALADLLPAWFFDPYSEEYKEYNGTQNAPNVIQEG